MEPNRKPKCYQVSYLTLRRTIGILGIALPVIVAVWGFVLCHCFTIRSSISDYYACRTRDALVGIMVSLALFLYTYCGYDRRDDWAGNIGCVFALGEALFRNHGSTFEETVHFLSSVGLFLVLAYFSLFLFTLSGDGMTPMKRRRNRLYRTCGVIMLVCLALMGAVYWLVPQGSPVLVLAPIFWLETLALWAFGISWLVKGETLWKDRPAT